MRGINRQFEILSPAMNRCRIRRATPVLWTAPHPSRISPPANASAATVDRSHQRAGSLRRLAQTESWPTPGRSAFCDSSVGNQFPASACSCALSYAIPRRLNTGTLAKSTMNAKTAAATSIPPTTKIGRGVMAIPQVASVEAISRSTTDDPTSHRLGREDPSAGVRDSYRWSLDCRTRWPRRPQFCSVSIPKPRRNLAMARTAVQKTSSADSHEDTRDRQCADSPGIGQWRTAARCPSSRTCRGGRR